MATQVASRAACWLDGIAVAAQDLRLQQVGGFLTAAAASGSTGIAATAGVRPGQGTPLASTWTSGMSFNLSAGVCYVQGTASTTAGLWTLELDTTTLLTVTTSDPTNPRIDSVIAVVVDNGNNTSTSVFKILPGTPAGSPVAPTLPANALRLANITVGAGVSTLSSGVFSDQRVWSVAVGGILPYGNTSGATINGPTGTYVHDLSSGRLKTLDGSGTAVPPKLAPFNPTTNTLTTNLTFPTSNTNTTIISQSVQTDGITPIEVQVSYYGVQQGTATVGDQVKFAIWIDGSLVGSDAMWVWTQSTTLSGVASGGGMFRWIGTPAAGTHTFAWIGNANGATNTITLQCTAGWARMWIRALPA